MKMTKALNEYEKIEEEIMDDLYRASLTISSTGGNEEEGLKELNQAKRMLSVRRIINSISQIALFVFLKK